MENIKDKILKLLRLGADAGATEAEATSAMAMASALMAKYGVAVSLEDDDSDGAIRGSWIGRGWNKRHHIELGSAVGYLYFCTFCVDRYSGSFQFVGRPDVVEAAEVTFTWLVTQVERLYKECLPRGMSQSDRAEYRKTFKIACAIRIRRRAWEIMTALRNDDALAIEATGQKAVVVASARDQALKEAQDLLEGVTRALAVRPTRLGIGSARGHQAGDTVQLQHGVTDKTTGITTEKLTHG